jgi:hypothetical protein
MNTPVGATVGGGGGRAAGGGADKAASDAKRALEIQKQQYQVADDRNTALKDTFALLQQTEAVAKRELELDIRLSQIAREFNTLKEEAKSADELAMVSLNENLEKKIAELEAEREINELLIQRATLVANLVKASSMPTVYNELETQDAALQAILDKYPAIGSAADAAATLATSGMAAMIDGTKSAQEVFAEFLNTIANALMQTAQLKLLLKWLSCMPLSSCLVYLVAGQALHHPTISAAHLAALLHHLTRHRLAWDYSPAVPKVARYPAAKLTWWASVARSCLYLAAVAPSSLTIRWAAATLTWSLTSMPKAVA